MTRTASLLVLASLAGCPDNNQQNPSVLWLAPDQAETHVKLVGTEPSSY